MSTKNIVTVTAEDFDLKYDDEHTFPFFEDEDGNGVYGYGHKDKIEFARQVNDYDELCNGGPLEFEYAADDVRHAYALAYETGSDREWRFTRADVTPETEGAFPMTWVTR